MRLSGIPSVAVSIALAAAAALSSGVGAYWSSRAVADATDWVAHTHEVQRTLEQVLSLLKDVETGQRGYLLTGDAAFLEPYDQALEALPPVLDRLDALVQDNSVQLAHLGPVRHSVGERLGISTSAVERLRVGDRAGAVGIVASGQGLQAMHRVRGGIAAMLAEEDRLLASRLLAAGQARERSALFAGLTTGLLLLLLATVYVTARRATARIAGLLQDVRGLNAGLERRVDERTRQLSEANEELEAFSYTVSHDLRAPLRGLQGFAQAVEEDYADRLDDEGRDYLRRIMAAARRMEGLIQDLLAYGRLSREDIALRPVNLQLALDEALAQLAAEIDHARAAMEVAQPLPTVRAHPTVLVQVVANLLGNALKFVAPGKPARVRVWSSTGEGRVRAFVQDHGIGIEPAHRERIFRVFERLHGQEAYPGTGVGLAIVRKGCERMGGTCGVESRPGEGSTFWFELEAA